ncbi:MAG TPA: hypothetical protein VGE07_29720 [Herpetosiphonaceae bacterium]
MSVYVLMKDETLTGKIMQELRIALASELTTVGELIAARVRDEVERYNRDAGEVFRGLVQPGDTELTLNGYRMAKDRRFVDAEKQVAVALAAFARNSFFVLVDDQQCGDLEQEVLIKPGTSVSFVKLTPLIGG